MHGNAEALRAIGARETVDEIICLGDVVGYGPAPGECLRWLRTHEAIAVQGNHDRALGEGVAPGCRPQFEWLADATYPIGHAQLTGEERTYLANLPKWVQLERDGVRYGLVHATPRDPLYAYLGIEARAWEEQFSGIDVDVLLVGHTHLQFDLRVGAKRVVNPGSAGQPKDGDPRAAYAVMEDRRIRLDRVAYPIARTVQALAAEGVAPPVVSDLAFLLRTGTPPRPHAVLPPA